MNSLKKENLLYYFLGLSQLAVLMSSLLTFINRYVNYPIIYKSAKYHLNIDIILSLLVLYGVTHFLKTKKVSSKMRKAAGKKREIKSKRIQLLMYFVMFSLIFHSLYYTVPMNKYHGSIAENIIFYISSGLQFLVLIKLVSSHEGENEDFAKSKQKYAGVGAISGLILFYTYFVLLN